MERLDCGSRGQDHICHWALLHIQKERTAREARFRGSHRRRFDGFSLRCAFKSLTSCHSVRSAKYERLRLIQQPGGDTFHPISTSLRKSCTLLQSRQQKGFLMILIGLLTFNSDIHPSHEFPRITTQQYHRARQIFRVTHAHRRPLHPQAPQPGLRRSS